MEPNDGKDYQQHYMQQMQYGQDYAGYMQPDYGQMAPPGMPGMPMPTQAPIRNPYLPQPAPPMQYAPAPPMVPNAAAQSKIKGKRRSKNETEGRNYKCNQCDRTYLSYPALYTHIKTKHSSQGEAPLTSGRGRGRPKKNLAKEERIDPTSPLFFRTEDKKGGPTAVIYQFKEAYDILYSDNKKYGGYERHPLYVELYKIHLKNVVNLNYTAEHPGVTDFGATPPTLPSAVYNLKPAEPAPIPEQDLPGESHDPDESDEDDEDLADGSEESPDNKPSPDVKAPPMNPPAPQAMPASAPAAPAPTNAPAPTPVPEQVPNPASAVPPQVPTPISAPVSVPTPATAPAPQALPTAAAPAPVPAQATPAQAPETAPANTPAQPVAPIPVDDKNKGKPEEDAFQKKKSKKCDEIFAEYLDSVAKYVNKDTYKEVLKFVFLFRECLNQHGDHLLKNKPDTAGYVPATANGKSDSNGEYCSTNNAEQAPEVSNEFVTLYLDDVKTNFGKMDAIELTQNFCGWLFNGGYTCSKLSLIQENPQ